MKTEEALKLNPRQIAKMSERELRKVVSTIRSTARKRYERLAKEGFYTKPMKTFSKGSPDESTVLPEVRHMDIIRLRNEYKRYKQFLQSKTSTVKGARKAEVRARSFVEDVSGRRDFTESEIAEILDMAKDLSLTDEIGHIMSSTDKVTAVAEYYNPKQSREEILQNAKQKVVDAYELQQRKGLPTSSFYQNPAD